MELYLRPYSQLYVFTLETSLISTKSQYDTQIREQMSGPDLHVFTLKFLALKKQFFHFFGVKSFLSAEAKVFSKIISGLECEIKGCGPEKVKKPVFRAKNLSVNT